MAIPGLKPNYEVRSKVRIGEKRVSAGGKSYPASVDYFICDDSEWVVLVGEKKNEVRIRLPFETASDNFSTGLEFWRGQQLTCYSKGEQRDGQNVAYRVESMVQPGDVKLGEKIGRGKERQPIVCAFRACAFFKDGACKPMGRLQFFLDGGRSDAVLQLDTKAWNTIEGIEATLGAAAASGDLRGRVFVLSVAIEQRGNQKFPVVSLKEADVVLNTDADVAKADALIAADARRQRGDDDRQILAELLDKTHPGWRDTPAFVARIKEVGATDALSKMIDAL